MAVAALSFEAPAVSSLGVEALLLSLDLSPGLVAGFLLGGMVRWFDGRCSEIGFVFERRRIVSKSRWFQNSASSLTSATEFTLSLYSKFLRIICDYFRSELSLLHPRANFLQHLYAVYSACVSTILHIFGLKTIT